MRSYRGQYKAKKGFTLLETLTVLAIIGILTSLTIVLYGNHRRAVQAQTSARQITALFTTARALAINQNAYFQVVLDLSTSGMWIDRIRSDQQMFTPKVTTPENWSMYVDLAEVTVDGVSPEDNLVKIRFFPNGTSQSARIVLVSEGGTGRGTGGIYTVRLYGPTARSRIFPGEQQSGETP